MTIALSGNNHIDALLSGQTQTGTVGNSVTLTYGFSTDIGTEVASNQTYAFVSAMRAWANVANIGFTPTHSATTADLIFEKSNLVTLGSHAIGATYFTTTGNSIDTDTTVAIDDRFHGVNSVAVGTQGYLTIMHELGHALGLEHPSNYGQGEMAPHLPSSEDNLSNTVMSYYGGNGVDQTHHVPITPMVDDIAAMQYMYGANHNYNSGDTDYHIGSGNFSMTIWDGGGADTLYAAKKSTLDLGEGNDHHSVIGKSLVWIAYGANIENAVGSKSADIIYGSIGDNELVGNTGKDIIHGGAGDDLIYGDYTDRGGSGKDTLYGETGNDSISGGGANDAIYGGDNNDLIYGDKGNDQLFGDAGNDSIYGGAGNDTITGGAGNDTLVGDAGRDMFVFGTGFGHDEIFDFEGPGHGKGDLIAITHGMGGYTSTEALAAAVSYIGLVGTLDLGGGNILTIHSSSHLTADDFKLV